MTTKSRLISKLIDGKGIVKASLLDSDGIGVSSQKSVTAAAGTATYSSADTLPTSAASGDQAFITSTNRLYIYSGSGWYNIALVNSTPYWSTEPASSYALSKTGAATIVTILAVDSDGAKPVYTATADSDFNLTATISKDSDNGRVFTIVPIDSENGAAAGGSGTVTFKASDGISLVSTVSTFTLRFADGDYFYVANSGYTATVDTASVTTDFVAGGDSTLATIGGVQGHIGSTGDSHLIWNLENTGGFDASTDLIVMSLYLPSFAGVTLGIGIHDNAANHGIMLAGYSGNGGIVKSTGSFFDMPALPAATWLIMAAGGGNSILSPSATASASGLRFWPANTSGGLTLGTEISAAISSGAGWSAQTMLKPGIIAKNGSNVSGYTTGTTRAALPWYIRSVQIYYDQTTSGVSIESIVGAHQRIAFG